MEQSKSSSFLIWIIQQILYVLESDRILFAIQKTDNNNNNGIDKDLDDEKANTTSTQYRIGRYNDNDINDNNYTVVIWQFIHRSLELLYDLLSTPPITITNGINGDVSNTVTNTTSTSIVIIHCIRRCQ
jgi:hypothetical protein